MIYDARGLRLTTTSGAAAGALEDATIALLGHRADLGAHLTRAFAADEDLVIAHALAGFCARIQAREELEPLATRHLAAARAALLRRGGTARERMLVAALAAWHEHADMPGAAALLRNLVQAQQHDILAIKLDHALRFMLGDALGMRIGLEQAALAWTPEIAGHGYLLGLRAFAMEETGETAMAEHLGRAAVAAEPADLWGAHAVAHVFEGDGRAREGLAWIGGLTRHLPQGGGFGRHILWHAALFHLHLGENDAALALLDRHIHDQPAEDVRDFANAASLLWRLEAQGLAVGQARWNALAEIAGRRVGERGLAFIDLHQVLALGAAGRHLAVAEKLAVMRERAEGFADPQADVLAECGVQVAEGLALASAGQAGAAVDLLLPLRGRLAGLGGSNAQRDVFERTLVRACLDAGRLSDAAILLEERATRRASGAWEATCARRLEDSLAVTA